MPLHMFSFIEHVKGGAGDDSGLCFFFSTGGGGGRRDGGPIKLAKYSDLRVGIMPVVGGDVVTDAVT